MLSLHNHFILRFRDQFGRRTSAVRPSPQPTQASALAAHHRFGLGALGILGIATSFGLPTLTAQTPASFYGSAGSRQPIGNSAAWPFAYPVQQPSIARTRPRAASNLATRNLPAPNAASHLASPGGPLLPPTNAYRTPAMNNGVSSSWSTVADFSAISLPAAPSSLLSRSGSPNLLTTSAEVSVFATPEILTTEGVQRSFTIQDVESAPGTFGDLPRFIQTLAGVVADNDQRNDYLVRGGSPTENLFMIDNIEVPSINQLAMSDTTGGLVSMLDNNAIQRFSFQDDAYSSRYDQRLSSVVDISTRTYGHVQPHREAEFGVAGTGGYRANSFGHNGAYFLSARSGILQYITNDIGFNGTPHYRNLFARAENTLGEHDSWWGMSLFGIDSIQIRPSALDPEETNPFNINYSGWRSATGINWQHVFSSKAFAVASLAHTEQTQNMGEFAQLTNYTPVYNEHSSDSVTTAKYDVTLTPQPWFLLQFGGRGAYDVMNYNVNQPFGLPNAYSTDPTPVNPGTFSSNTPALSSAAYADANWTLPHQIHISAGERFSEWTVDGRHALTGRASAVAPILGHSVFVNYAEHAQLPPELYLLAFNNLSNLRPIRSRQLSAGITALDQKRIHLTLAAYNKRYSDYPVSTQFSQVSLANISDTFGQAFLLFPMRPQGTGVARGVEATLNAEISSRLTISETASYARSWFAGTDGILRRGNFDIPLSTNTIVRWSLGKDFLFSARYNATSGRPYTPDNFPLSFAQNRDVYDLNHINGLRSWSYQRLDVHFEQNHKLNEHKLLTWWVGAENVTDHKNFYDELWEPRLQQYGITSITPNPQAQSNYQAIQHQLGLFPDGGIRMSF